MAAFFHVIWKEAYRQLDSEFMGVFAKLRFKMKLGYECWR